MPLVPCPCCGRHVRLAEQSCPFCETAIPAGLVPVPAAPRRLGRGAAFVFASTLAAVGCGGQTTTPPEPTDAVADDGSMIAKYGGPADTFVDDTGGTAPMYGAPAYGVPPMDTGLWDTSAVDTGTGAGRYGGPPPEAG